MPEYIVCDALDNFKNDIIDTFIDMCRGNDYNKLTLLQIGDAIDCVYDKHIEKHYTADVVEVRHGKYIQASKTAQIGLKCSLCGARIKYSEYFNGNHHYCYKCGAKMDGKGDGE